MRSHKQSAAALPLSAKERSKKNKEVSKSHSHFTSREEAVGDRGDASVLPCEDLVERDIAYLKSPVAHKFWHSSNTKVFLTNLLLGFLITEQSLGS